MHGHRVVPIRDIFRLGDLADDIRAGIEKAIADEERHAAQGLKATA